MSSLVQDPKADILTQLNAQSVGRRDSISDSAPIADTRPLAIADRTRRIVATMSSRGQRATTDGSSDAAEVIATAIRFVMRRGRMLDALPRSTRLQLDQLCEAGDPAACLVRDWIECKLPEPIATALAQADGEANVGRA